MRSEGLALAIWEAVRDEVPAGKRVDVAEALLRAFHEHGADARDLAELADEDAVIADAYQTVFGEELGDDEEEGEGY